MLLNSKEYASIVMALIFESVANDHYWLLEFKSVTSEEASNAKETSP